MGNASTFCYDESDDGYARSALWQHAGEADHAVHPTLAALLHGQHVLYALRLEDGVIKIGCTKNLANRASGLHGNILGFRPGDFDDEKAIHDDLKAHRARGREYYHPRPEVLAVVNDMRDDFGLPHIAA